MEDLVSEEIKIQSQKDALDEDAPVINDDSSEEQSRKASGVETSEEPSDSDNSIIGDTDTIKDSQHEIQNEAIKDIEDENQESGMEEAQDEADHQLIKYSEKISESNDQNNEWAVEEEAKHESEDADLTETIHQQEESDN